MKTRRWLTLALVVALAGLALFGLGGALAAPSGPESPAGTVQGTVVQQQALYITSTETVYGDPVRLRYYNSFDAFISANFSTTGQITVGVQFSPDSETWFDAYYPAEGWVLPLSYSTTVTNGTVLLEMDATDAEYVWEAIRYSAVISGDNNRYLRNVPVTGWYGRAVIEPTGDVTDGLDVDLWWVLRNN